MTLDRTMKALLAFVGLALWSLLIAGIARPDSRRLQRIETRLDELHATIADIGSDLSDLEADLSDLEADVSDLEDDLADQR
jgi:type II secretory pathway component PulM